MSKGKCFLFTAVVASRSWTSPAKLTYVHQCTGGHWLCLDPNGSFSRTQPKHFERVTPEGVRPAIIFADGGAPIAVCEDGNLYYASNWAGGDDHAPGGLTISRVAPDGKLSHVSPSLKETLAKLDEDGTGSGAERFALRRLAQQHFQTEIGRNDDAARATWSRGRL